MTESAERPPQPAGEHGVAPTSGPAPQPGDPGYGPPTAVPPNPPSIGAGLRWAWARFTPNAGVVVGAAIAWIAILTAAFITFYTVIVLTYIIAISAAHESPGGQFAIVMVMAMMLLLIAAVPASCWLNGLVTIADGHQARVGDFFHFRAVKSIAAIHLLVGLVAALVQTAFTYGLHLPWIAGAVTIVIGLPIAWIAYFAADAHAPVGTAVASGLRLTAADVRATVAVYLTSLLLVIVGLLLFVYGAVVTAPLAGLLTLYCFRSLMGHPVAAETHPAAPV
ncbi:hypothetical protein [Gordonia phthalatica]|nr:hypothetical protein [Gordonia phthalatica]